MISHLYLDLDGVLADFHGAAARLFGQPDIVDRWPEGVWPMWDVLGITEWAFWEPIAQIGQRFWSDSIQPCEWADDLLAWITQSGIPWSIATEPTGVHGELDGKLAWIKRHLGHNVGWAMTNDKSRLAGPGRVLVDDSDAQCAAWMNACWGKGGAEAILFPRPWNALAELAPPAAMANVLETLEIILEEGGSKP